MAPIVDIAPVRCGELDVRVDHGPCERPFEMGLDIRESQPQSELRFGLHVILYQVL